MLTSAPVDTTDTTIPPPPSAPVEVPQNACLQEYTGGPVLPAGEFVTYDNETDPGVTGTHWISGIPCGPAPSSAATVAPPPPPLPATGPGGLEVALVAAGLAAVTIGSLLCAVATDRYRQGNAT